jgi:hypothetical protein
MEQLPTGDVEYRGVPFRLQGGERACVVLDSPRRPQSRLPKSVTLPVGRKADILYVVHSGAMLTHDKPNWRYRVRYADGESRPIDVVPGVNVRDYGEALNQEFMNPPGMRTTVGPDTCRNALSGCCGVFIMEWLNPRPQADIKDIEMVSGGEGVPILLAITGGVKK